MSCLFRLAVNGTQDLVLSKFTPESTDSNGSHSGASSRGPASLGSLPSLTTVCPRLEWGAILALVEPVISLHPTSGRFAS